MKKILLIALLLAGTAIVRAQFTEPKITPSDPSLPAWVKLMYGDNPNVYRVDSAYQAYYKTNPFRETSFTRYYMRWRVAVNRDLDDRGFIAPRSAAERVAAEKPFGGQRTDAPLSGTWSFAGPDVHLRARYSAADPVIPLSEQANTYCIDQSQSDPNVLYCGTESGGVYKTVDKGAHWMLVSQGLPIYSVSAVAVNPQDENEVLFGASGVIYKSTDGGTTWAPTGSAAFQASNVNPWQIEFHPTNPQIILAACDKGLYRTTNGGTDWVQVFAGESMSVAFKPTDPSTVYALQYSPTSKISGFFKSTDGGQTFALKSSGWFTVPSGDQGKIGSHGGRIAVTKANPNRVYVLLVGNSEASATLQLGGYIGVYSSANAGESWTLPQQLIGMPYNLTTHPNLMDFDGHSSSYNQIYYNTALIVSQLNENRLLIGGLNLWRSDDGAATYQPVGGYIGSIPYYHVDIQEMKVYKTSATTEEAWIASDGGVNYTLDFGLTHESRCNGLWAGAFWGFDQGWNDDIRVGGRYHNGNGGYFEGYPANTYLALGGGEAPTGYVNYSDERKTLFSDIGGRVLPENPDSLVHTFSMINAPNESYWENGSSRVLFDWRYWNVAYMGKDNAFMRSTDGGGSFVPMYTFGTNTANKVLWIEQSFSDPDIFYLQIVVNNTSRLFRSADGGTTWANVNQPVGYTRNLVFTQGFSNPDELWVAYTYGSNGQKVFHTADGGATWQNLSTATLNNIHIKAISCQAGTPGTVYIAAPDGIAFYRKQASSDWLPLVGGLPAGIDPLRLAPFYRDAKLRLGTWNMAIWEIPLQDSSHLMANFSANFASFYCPGDTIRFVNHSVCSGSATCHWSFPGGTPSASTSYNPKVVYSQPGSYDVTLVVTDGTESDTITRTGFITASEFGILPINEGFESGNLPSTWKLNDDGRDGVNWAVAKTAGGFGNSTASLLFDNFDIDVAGRQDEVWCPKLDLSQISDLTVTFDVAYSEYGGQYSDTLAVLATGDCGESYTEFYREGGQSLATAPNFTSAIFIPTATQWRTDTVHIGGFAGNPEVIVAFRNIGHWGQAIYVDNVRIVNLFPVGSGNAGWEASLRVAPNPSPDGHFRVYLRGMKDEYRLTVFDARGQSVYSCIAGRSTGESVREIDLGDRPDGIYMLHAVTGGKELTKKLVKCSTAR